jgi:hypothetical protein
MLAFYVICKRCDARVPIGGNEDPENPRLAALIKAGWDYQPRGVHHCPECVKKRKIERVRDAHRYY